MFDVNFYMNTILLKDGINDRKCHDRKAVLDLFEESRSPWPVLFNIETTNICNMKCVMCPRKLMTRPTGVMAMDLFEKVALQMTPWPKDTWRKWELFVSQFYGVSNSEVSENAFFFYVVARAMMLHGYGEPMLDPLLVDRVKLLSTVGLPAYLSCNPTNVTIDKGVDLMRAGLDYLKFSIDGTTDVDQKSIRGNSEPVKESVDKILRLLTIKHKERLNTKFVITMLNLHDHKNPKQFQKLEAWFANSDVFLFLKSADQKWYKKNLPQTKSMHWSEYCHAPWASMTVLWDGTVVPCNFDYNAEMKLGNAWSDYLWNIWSSEQYAKFRKEHFYGNRHLKCNRHCDIKPIGYYVR